MSKDVIKARLDKFRKKLDVESKDEYYANTVARLDTIIGDAGQVWSMVSSAKNDYDSITASKESFYVWLQETYGIKLQFTPDGDLQLANEIVNEEKYLIFALKYSGKK
jgi:hypothetical protein